MDYKKKIAELINSSWFDRKNRTTYRNTTKTWSRRLCFPCFQLSKLWKAPNMIAGIKNQLSWKGWKIENLELYVNFFVDKVGTKYNEKILKEKMIMENQILEKEKQYVLNILHPNIKAIPCRTFIYNSNRKCTI